MRLLLYVLAWIMPVVAAAQSSEKEIAIPGRPCECSRVQRKAEREFRKMSEARLKQGRIKPRKTAGFTARRRKFRPHRKQHNPVRIRIVRDRISRCFNY